jgi:hypothetical protein
LGEEEPVIGEVSHYEKVRLCADLLLSAQKTGRRQNSVSEAVSRASELPEGAQ